MALISKMQFRMQTLQKAMSSWNARLLIKTSGAVSSILPQPGVFDFFSHSTSKLLIYTKFLV